MMTLGEILDLDKLKILAEMWETAYQKGLEEASKHGEDLYKHSNPIRSYDAKVKITGRSKGVAEHYPDAENMV